MDDVDLTILTFLAVLFYSVDDRQILPCLSCYLRKPLGTAAINITDYYRNYLCVYV